MAAGMKYGLDEVLEEGTEQFELRTPPPRLLEAHGDEWEDIREADIPPDVSLTSIFR